MKKICLLMFAIALLAGCEQPLNEQETRTQIERNTPLIGTTYKSHNAEWESFTFYEQKYRRDTPLWQESGIEWWGYYSLQDSIIYCYYDQLPYKVEFTLKYKGDSIIDDDDDIRYRTVFYKQ